MTTKRILFEEFLYNLVFFVFFYGMFILFAAVIFNTPESSLWLLLLALPFTFNFLARRYIRNILLMLIVHAIAPALAFYLIYDLFLQAFVVAILVIIALFSFVKRMKSSLDLDTLGGLFLSVALIAMCLISINFGYYYVSGIYPVLIVILIISVEIFCRMVKTDMSLEAITQTSKQPVKQILQLDHKMMLALCALLVPLSIMLHFVLIEPIISRIHMPDIDISGSGDPFVPPMPAQGASPGDILMLLGDAPEPHPFWQFLDMVLQFVIQAAITMLFLGLFIGGLINIYKLLTYRKRPTPSHDGWDEKTFVIPEKVVKPRQRLREFIASFIRQEDAIRKMFRKKILRHKKLGVAFTQSDTPFHMAARIKKEDINELTKEYEKVRYGGKSNFHQK